MTEALLQVRDLLTPAGRDLVKFAQFDASYHSYHMSIGDNPVHYDPHSILLDSDAFYPIGQAADWHSLLDRFSAVIILLFSLGSRFRRIVDMLSVYSPVAKTFEYRE